MFDRLAKLIGEFDIEFLPYFLANHPRHSGVMPLGFIILVRPL